VVSQTCGGFPPTTKVPQRTSRSPVLPPYGASSFWGLNPKSGPDQTPPCVPSRPGPPRPGGFACPPSSADQAIPGTRQHRGALAARPMRNVRHFPSPSPQAISARLGRLGARFVHLVLGLFRTRFGLVFCVQFEFASCRPFALVRQSSPVTCKLSQAEVAGAHAG
jgi:hypothetical protein